MSLGETRGAFAQGNCQTSGGVPEDGDTFSTAAFSDFTAEMISASSPGLWSVWQRLRWKEHCDLVYDLRETLLEPPKHLFIG